MGKKEKENILFTIVGIIFNNFITIVLFFEKNHKYSYFD